MGKRHLKMLKNLAKPRTEKKNNFAQILNETMIKEEGTPLTEELLDSAKYFWFKKKKWNLGMPTMFSVLLVCILLTYQNCNGANGGTGGLTSLLNGTAVSNPSYVPESEGSIKLSGKTYFSSMVNKDTGKNYLIQMSFKNNGGYEGRLVSYEGSKYYYQEDKGSFELLSGERLKLSYSYETCESVGSEEFIIKIGPQPDTIILQAGDKSEFVMYRSGAYQYPSYVTSATVGEEDKSCKAITDEESGSDSAPESASSTAVSDFDSFKIKVNKGDFAYPTYSYVNVYLKSFTSEDEKKKFLGIPYSYSNTSYSNMSRVDNRSTGVFTHELGSNLSDLKSALTSLVNSASGTPVTCGGACWAFISGNKTYMIDLNFPMIANPIASYDSSSVGYSMLYWSGSY